MVGAIKKGASTSMYEDAFVLKNYKYTSHAIVQVNLY